jgi:hypothetical protein
MFDRIPMAGPANGFALRPGAGNACDARGFFRPFSLDNRDFWFMVHQRFLVV